MNRDVLRAIEQMQHNELTRLAEQLDKSGITRSLGALSSAAGEYVSQYQNILDQVANFINPVNRALTEAMDVASKINWQALANSFDISESFSGLLGDSQVREVFSELGLVPSPSMDPQLIEEVVSLHESGSSKAEVLAIVLEHFDEDGSARLNPIVDKLTSIDDLAGWSDVLHEVLQAHRIHLDAITAYPLVAMIEGSLTSGFYPLVENHRQDLKHGKLADHLLDIPLMYITNVKIESLMCLVSYMEDSLYHSSNWWDDENTRKQYIELNRHRLLHGMAERGTRLNTLRCFLMLDVIGEIVPGLRKLAEDNDRNASDVDDDSSGL